MKGERKRGVVRRSKGWHIYDRKSEESSYSFTGRILEGRHTRPYVKRERRVITPVYKSAFFYATKQWGGGGYPTERENSYMGLSITGGIRPNGEGLGDQPGI